MTDFEYEYSTDNNMPSNRQRKRLPKDDNPITFLGLTGKIILTNELQILVSSGIPIVEALNSLETAAPNNKIKTICKNLKIAVESGYTLSEAIEKLYAEVFGKLYISLVQAGEQSGRLESTLERLLILLRKQDAIKSKVISASIYPGFLILLIFGIAVFFSSFVLPRVLMAITASGESIPVMTAKLMTFSTFISNFWWLIILVIAGAVWLIIKSLKNSAIKRRWDRFVMFIPFLNEFILYANLSNFMAALSATYETGLPVLEGVELATGTIGNNTIKTQFYTSLPLLKRGSSLSEALYRTGMVPSLIFSIISSGEKAGSLSKMMDDASAALDKKVDMALSVLTRLYEPVTIVIVGLIVFFIAVALLQGTSVLGI